MNTRNKNIILAIAFFTVVGIIVYWLYIKVLSKLLTYFGYKLVGSEVGTKVPFTQVTPVSDFDIAQPIGTIVSFDTAQVNPGSISQTSIDSLKVGSLLDLDTDNIYKDRIKLRYAILSANVNGTNIRDFRFGVVFEVIGVASVRDVSDVVGNIVWLKSLLDETDAKLTLQKQGFILS